MEYKLDPYGKILTIIFEHKDPECSCVCGQWCIGQTLHNYPDALPFLLEHHPEAPEIALQLLTK